MQTCLTSTELQLSIGWTLQRQFKVCDCQPEAYLPEINILYSRVIWVIPLAQLNIRTIGFWSSSGLVWLGLWWSKFHFFDVPHLLKTWTFMHVDPKCVIEIEGSLVRNVCCLALWRTGLLLADCVAGPSLPIWEGFVGMTFLTWNDMWHIIYIYYIHIPSWGRTA